MTGTGWCPQDKWFTRAQPIHFGKADSVECTLLRVTCQSETFLAPPWQGDANIRFLWHIVCQSELDELVSMASRPVDRGFDRMGNLSTSFHPAKSGFARTAETKVTFHPAKGRFGRTGTFWDRVARSKRLPSDGNEEYQGVLPARNPKNTFEHLPHSTAFC